MKISVWVLAMLGVFACGEEFCDSTPRRQPDGSYYIACIPPGGTVELPFEFPVLDDPHAVAPYDEVPL